MNHRRLERIVKGFANHRRIGVVDLLYKKPELSVEQVAVAMKINFSTASEHINRLAISGLIMKRHEGIFVRHKLTNRGISVLKFLKTLE